MKKCKSMKKILLILIVGVSCMSVFGQSDAKIPMFITGIKNQTLELHTSCVKRPTDVGVVVSVVFYNDLRDISRQPRPTDVRLQFIEGYMDGRKRKGRWPTCYYSESEIRKRYPDRCIWRLCENTIVEWMWHQPYAEIKDREYLFPRYTMQWSFRITVHLLPD